MKKIIFILPILLMYLNIELSIANNQVEVLLSTNKTNININDTFEIELSIKIKGNINIEPNITLIGTEGFQDIGSSMTNNIEIINGNTMQTQSLKKLLKPTTTGTFIIGPSILKTNIGEIKSNTITITVSEISNNIKNISDINNMVSNINDNFIQQLNITHISIIFLVIILIISIYFLIRLEKKDKKHKEINIQKHEIHYNVKKHANTDKKLINSNIPNNTNKEKKEQQKSELDLEIDELCKTIVEQHNISIKETNNFYKIIQILINKNIDSDLIDTYKQQYNNIQKKKWGNNK